MQVNLPCLYQRSSREGRQGEQTEEDGRVKEKHKCFFYILFGLN